jgi:hypothetical protein
MHFIPAAASCGVLRFKINFKKLNLAQLYCEMWDECCRVGLGQMGSGTLGCSKNDNELGLNPAQIAISRLSPLCGCLIVHPGRVRQQIDIIGGVAGTTYDIAVYFMDYTLRCGSIVC